MGGTVLFVEIRTMRAFHFRYSPIARGEVSEIRKNFDALQKKSPTASEALILAGAMTLVFVQGLASNSGRAW